MERGVERDLRLNLPGHVPDVVPGISVLGQLRGVALELEQAGLDRAAELETVDEIVGIDVDEQGAAPGRPMAGDGAQHIEQRGTARGRFGDRADVVEVERQAVRGTRAIGTPRERRRIPARARQRVGWFEPSPIRDDHTAAVQRRVDSRGGTHEATERGGHQLGRPGFRAEACFAGGALTGADRDALEPAFGQ